MPERHALVTGASAGIGAAIARALAARGAHVALTARRGERLQALAEELERRHRVRTLCLPADLADPATPERLAAALTRAGWSVDWLVNNAGYGLTKSFLAHPWSAHAAFLQVMVAAPVELCHRLLPGMRERGYGRILNVASLAGLVPSGAGHTLYGGAKSLLIQFSRALGGEERARGIHVTALCPGFTYSEFHDVNGMRGKVSQLPAYLWLTAEQVAEAGIRACEGGERVHVPGAVNRLVYRLTRWLPGRLAQRWMDHQSERFRDQGE